MKVFTLMLAATLAAGGLLAQGPGRGPRGFRPRAAAGPGGPGCRANGRTPDLTAITNYLTLTADQVSSLQSIQSNFCSTTQAARQKIAEDQKSLRDMQRQGSTDASAMGNLLVDIEAQRKSIQAAQSSLMDQATSVLTDAQKTQLANLAAAQKLEPAIRQATFLNLLARPQGRGPGGPAGPPPPQ
jgi:hypothetical protein